MKRATASCSLRSSFLRPSMFGKVRPSASSPVGSTGATGPEAAEVLAEHVRRVGGRHRAAARPCHWLRGAGATVRRTEREGRALGERAGAVRLLRDERVAVERKRNARARCALTATRRPHVEAQAIVLARAERDTLIPFASVDPARGPYLFSRAQPDERVMGTHSVRLPCLPAGNWSCDAPPGPLQAAECWM